MKETGDGFSFTSNSRRHFGALVCQVPLGRRREAVVSLQEAHGRRNRAARRFLERVQGSGIFGRPARSPFPETNLNCYIPGRGHEVYRPARKSTTDLPQIRSKCSSQQRSPLATFRPRHNSQHSHGVIIKQETPTREAFQYECVPRISYCVVYNKIQLEIKYTCY